MSIVVVNQSGTNWFQFGASAASAIGTIAAVVLALLIARRDGARRDEERRDAEAGQARLVNFETDQSGAASDPAKIVIVNHSSQPVHNLEMISVLAIDKETRERYAANKTSSGQPLRGTQVRLRPYGAHDTSDTWRISPAGWAPEGNPEAEQQWRPRSGGWAGADFECRYRFTDHAGLRWERLNNHPPQRIFEDAGADDQPDG